MGRPDAGVAAALEGRKVLVAVSGRSLAARLASGLERHGARVRQLDAGAALHEKAQAEAAFQEAVQPLEGLDLVVHAAAAPAALSMRMLERVSATDWHAAVHHGLLATLHCLQAAHARMKEGGGAVVVLGPSTALVGAAGLVPLMTLAEGQRTLVKSAARQWGALGIRCNWVGIPPAQYDPALAGLAMPQVPELGPPPPALGRRPEADADIADTIAWLGSAGAAALTGGTFNLDGGEWMVP